MWPSNMLSLRTVTGAKATSTSVYWKAPELKYACGKTGIRKRDYLCCDGSFHTGVPKYNIIFFHLCLLPSTETIHHYNIPNHNESSIYFHHCTGAYEARKCFNFQVEWSFWKGHIKKWKIKRFINLHLILSGMTIGRKLIYSQSTPYSHKEKKSTITCHTSGTLLWRIIGVHFKKCKIVPLFAPSYVELWACSQAKKKTS